MMKVRKKLFTLSGLFMVLAQIFVAAFCGITAIAVTQEETTQSLYSNEYGSAAMSYELLENDRIKWTLTLAKTDQQTATQFMVDLAVDGNPLVPENVMSEGISLTGASSNGHIQAGLSEAASTMGGSGTVTFETAREIGTLTATPQLITSVEVLVETSVAAMVAEVTTETPGEETEAVQPAEEPPVQTETVVTNLLDGVGQTTFAIPDVEVVEEIDPEEPTDPNMPENDGGEVTGTDVVEGEEPGEVTEDEGDEEARNNISNGIFAVEQDDKIESTVEKANRNAKLSSTVSNFTSLKVTKNWKDMTEVIEKAKTVQFRLLRRIKSTGKYENYCTHPESGECDEECNEVYELTYDGSATSVFNWYNLPIYEGEGAERKGPYEYSAVELENSYYETIQNPAEPKPSVINSSETITENSSTVWKFDNITYFVAQNTDNTWLIWTADHIPLDKRSEFAKTIVNFGSDKNQPMQDFSKINDYTGSDVVWAEGNQDPGGIAKGITIQVDRTSIDRYAVTITFSAESIWTKFMRGGHSMREVNITNTYIPQNDITIQKVWADNDSSTREPIRLELQQKIEGKEWSLYDSFDIETDATTLSKDYSVPSKVGGKSAIYQVVEFVKNSDGKYEKRNVTGYKDPVYSHPDGAAEGILKVTNELIEYDITVQKVWNDGANKGNTRKNIQLFLEQSLDGGDTWNPWGDRYKIGTEQNSVLSHKFTVPAAVGGKLAQYRLTEKVQQAETETVYQGDRVPGYATPVYSNINGISGDGTLTVTNTLLETGLSFTKVGNDGKTPLSGAKFTITGTTAGGNEYSEEATSQDITGALGRVTFTGLQEGSYTLSETIAPVGYESVGPWKFNVVYRNNQLVIDWVTGTSPIQNGKLVNNLKKFDLTVNKKDDLEQPLEGAVFELVDQDENKYDVTVAGASFTFKDLPAPGTYTLKETTAPDGYALLTEEITITISSLGVVTVVGATADDTPPLTGGPGNNVISFDVANKKKVPLPATGGSGTMMFVTIGVLALTATGLYFLKRKDQEVA